MSILLEALRKSEKSKRAHEVPSIHDEDGAGVTPESMATGPLTLLLVSALFVSGWFVWHQYQPPAADALTAQVSNDKTREIPAADNGGPTPEGPEADIGSQAPVAETQGSAVASESAVTKRQSATIRRQLPASSATDKPASVKASTPENPKSARPGSSRATGEESSGKQRTPMESYKPPIRSASRAKPAADESTKTSRPITESAAASDDQPAPAEPETKPAVAVIEPTPEPEEPLPINYLELPDSVRANVPEIKFSVLVYSRNPSDRFVLINGERLMEGDNAGADLVVKEIRREGVIFSYRLYQFLVEK